MPTVGGATEPMALVDTWGSKGQHRGKRSVHSQDTHATGAATRTAEVAAVAGRCLYIDIEGPRSGDHGRGNRDRQLRIVCHCGGNIGVIENHDGRRDELATGRRQHETARRLRESNRRWRN